MLFCLFSVFSLIAPSVETPIDVFNPPTELLSFIDTTTESKIQQSTLYLKANFLQHRGKYHQALKIYNDLFTLDAPSYVYDGYLRLLSQTNQFDAIASLIDKTQEQFKDDLEIQIIYAQSLLNTNRNKQARERLEKLKKKYPNNEQIVYYSAAHNEKVNNLQKALEDITTFLQKRAARAKQFLFYFLKAKILLKMGSHAQSLQAIDQSLALFPQFDKGVLFKALILEQMQQIDGAIESYKEYLDLVGRDPAIIKQVVQLLFSQQRFGQAADQLKRLSDNQPEYFFDLALLEWKAKRYTQALEDVEKALKKNPNFTKAKLLKIEVFAALDKKTEIAQIMLEWLLKEPANNELVKLLLRLTQNVILPEQAINCLNQTHAKHSQLTNITLAMADLHLKTKQYENAIKYYKKTNTMTKNNALKAKISFQIGFIHFTTNKIKEATDTLEKALTQKTIYPPTYNLMAYMLARLGTDLTRALELIDKALIKNPESPYFLDTKAFILDRQGKHGDAIKTFNQALTIAPKDTKILEHLNNAKQKLLQKSTSEGPELMPVVCPIK